MTIYKPYTYLIGWTKLNQWYYGCQFGIKARPENLWKTYFTSSKYVKQMREYCGEPDIIQIRKIFKDKKLTKRCERRILEHLNAAKSSNWLNMHNGGDKFYIIKHSDYFKEFISKLNKGKKLSPETKEKIRQAKLGKSPKNPPWNKGIKMSPEKAEQFRLSKIGKERPDVSERNKIIHKGKKLTIEQKLAISISRKNSIGKKRGPYKKKSTRII